jgi:hypothetical protein
MIAGMGIHRKKLGAIIADLTLGTALAALIGSFGMLDSAEQAFRIFGVAFAAVCVWLTVGIVNRRERGATWTKKPGVLLLAHGIGFMLMPYWVGCLDSLLWKYDPFFWSLLPWFPSRAQIDYLFMAVLPLGLGMALLGLIKIANARRRGNRALP